MRSGIKVAFLNATSLKKHRSQLHQALSADSFYHVFGLVESRLKSEIDDCHIDMPGYSVLRQDHNPAGGGIILYVKNNLKKKVLHTSKTTQQCKPLLPEYITVWEEHSPPTLIVLVYRPPNVPIRSDKQLVRILRSACSDYSHKIIMGDWNADMSTQNCPDSRFIRELMAELSLKLVETGPSHHAPTKSSWIHIILTAGCDSILDFDRRLSSFPSRHDIISVTISTFRPVQSNTTYSYRNIRKITPGDLCSTSQNCDWSAFFLYGN